MMDNNQFIQVRDLLGLTNHGLGVELRYTHTRYQCKQVDNLASGTSKITYVVVLALECLCRRKGKLKEFKAILEKE
ncbi:hypothetical protein [Enterovibrio norvegicus]|uniref:hypothetical protein n=1 Tax=Enterovibrio norvegicus TaxID=188144 RepID=UPI00352CCC9E